MKTKSSLFLALVAAFFSLAAAPRSRAPKQVIEEGSEKVRSILKQKAPKGSKAEQDQKTELKKIVDGFLDYRELARRSLGQHWEARKAQEQTEFTQLLRDLIEASYTSAIRSNADYTLKQLEEEIAPDGASATITCTASAKNSKGKLVSVDLIFHLYPKDNEWMIYDVEFDDISLVRHYRTEFNRKIKKESYEALVTAMRKKLEELRSGKSPEKEIKL